jgi:RNA polymerase sigma-70 factor (ECF subfamily)
MAVYNKLTDEQLIVLLKKDDQPAFTEIYNRYAESLAGFAASKLYSLDDARDVIHDLFVKLWENRDEVYVTSNLKSYLFAIVRHRIIDKIRRNITREEYASMVQALIVPSHDSADKQVEAKEFQQTIEKSLNQLPPRVKEIYKLSRDEGLSNHEIAEKLNLSEQTVKNQLSAALKHLRSSLSSIEVVVFMLWWLL